MDFSMIACTVVNKKMRHDGASALPDAPTIVASKSVGFGQRVAGTFANFLHRAAWAIESGALTEKGAQR